MKKKYLIILVCFIAVVLFAALYVFVMYDSDKSKPSPTPTPTPTPTEAPIINDKNKSFEIQNFGIETYPYISGVVTNKIDTSKQDCYSVTNYKEFIINTTLVDGKRIICGIPENTENYVVSEDATSMIFLLKDREDYCPSLFMYDGQTDSVQKISDDVIAGYDSKYFNTISFSDGSGVKWIGNPKLSDDNLFAVYESNRRLYEAYVNEVLQAPDEIRYSDGENHIPYPKSDIWLKDLTSGEDYLLIEDAQVSCFVGRTLIYTQYLSGVQKIFSINIDTKEVTQLSWNYDIPNGYNLSVILDKYLCFLGNEEINCYNLISNSSVNLPIKEDGFTAIGKQIIKSDDGNCYALIQYKDTNNKFYIGLINLETSDKKMYSFVGEQVQNMPSIVGIIDNSKIITTSSLTPDRGTSLEFYLVEIEEYTR